MGRRLSIHPTHPQGRLIAQAASALRDGKTVVYPTDSLYGFACAMEANDAQEEIRIARRGGKSHFFTLVCSDLSELSRYARVDNAQYRLIKSLTPGPYTFILQATRELPRRLQDKKRKSVGLRIPDNAVAQALLSEFGAPILSTTVSYEDNFFFDVDDIEERFDHLYEYLLDAGSSELEETSVIDCTSGEPTLIRRGLGPVDDMMSVRE
ncbi:MAG: L-threonylcarbamoyladenylate synthase [Gammaproteobacteria bacterium]